MSNSKFRVRKITRSGYKNAIGGLFLVIPAEKIVKQWILKPIMLMLGWMAQWASTIEVKEGEEAVHVIRYTNGKAHIYEGAISKDGARVIKGYDPAQMLHNLGESLDERKLKESMALALLPYAEGEEPDDESDDDEELMDVLLKQAPAADLGLEE